jgi:hypothetical protein
VQGIFSPEPFCKRERLQAIEASSIAEGIDNIHPFPRAA